MGTTVTPPTSDTISTPPRPVEERAEAQTRLRLGPVEEPAAEATPVEVELLPLPVEAAAPPVEVERDDHNTERSTSKVTRLAPSIENLTHPDGLDELIHKAIQGFELAGTWEEFARMCRGGRGDIHQDTTPGCQIIGGPTHKQHPGPNIMRAMAPREA